MPTKKTIAILIAAIISGSANVSDAGCLDWLWGPRTTANYAPTTVGYFPNGVVNQGGPAAAYYTTNYQPYTYAAPAQTTYYPPAVSTPVATPNAVPSAAANTVYRAPLNGYFAAPSTTLYRAPRTTYHRAPTSTYYQPATTGYATAKFPATGVVTNYAPNGYSPTTVYQPVTPAPRRSWLGNLFNWGTGCDGLSPCRPYTATSANYRPRTTFRPTWQRVPVTYYRPITSVDPVTGQQVQRMQPCTTYRWQIQQRPALIAPRTAPANAYCAPTPAAGAAVSGGAPTNAADPYYDRSRIIRPSDDGQLIPKDAEILRDERIPANERPRLQGAPAEPTDLGAIPRGSTRTHNAASTRPDPVTRKSTRQPPSRQTAKPRSGLMLDPNADDSYPEPPALLTPRDKTAAVSMPTLRQVGYEAQWPRVKPTVRRAAAPQSARTAEPVEPITRRQPTRRLDDSGWRSLRD